MGHLQLSLWTINVYSISVFRAAHVLYVANQDGLIKKLSVLSRSQKTCVLEVWQPFTAMSVSRKIYAMKFAAVSILCSFLGGL